jgi:hypothetical protein
MAATKKRDQSKISPIEVSTLSGEPRLPEAHAGTGFLNGLETSWLLNQSPPVEDVAMAWRDSQLAQMTTGPRNRQPG